MATFRLRDYGSWKRSGTAWWATFSRMETAVWCVSVSGFAWPARQDVGRGGVVVQSAAGTFSHCVCVSASARRRRMELVLCGGCANGRAEIWDGRVRATTVSVVRVKIKPLLRRSPAGLGPRIRANGRREPHKKSIPLLPFRSDPLNY